MLPTRHDTDVTFCVLENESLVTAPTMPRVLGHMRGEDLHPSVGAAQRRRRSRRRPLGRLAMTSRWRSMSAGRAGRPDARPRRLPPRSAWTRVAFACSTLVHVARHLSAAVDQVRRSLNRALRRQGDDRLVKTRQLRLTRRSNMTQRQTSGVDRPRARDRCWWPARGRSTDWRCDCGTTGHGAARSGCGKWSPPTAPRRQRVLPQASSPVNRRTSPGSGRSQWAISWK